MNDKTLGGCYPSRPNRPRRITPSPISIILQMILSLIQNTHARSKIVSRDVSREEEEEPFL